MDNIDEDLKKKIESTKFVFMVAGSGIGKTFAGDYLEAIRGWKHIDGDTPLKQASSNPEYKNAVDQCWRRGDYADKDEEWEHSESWKAYMKILARLALEGARDSDTVVVTHTSAYVAQRMFLREQLIDAGARDVSMVYLVCDFDVLMQALWKRTVGMAEQAGMTVKDFFRGLGFDVKYGVSVVDFDSFVEFNKVTLLLFDQPADSEQPYTVVNVTAKDVTVFDGLDEAFGIETNTSRGDLSYDEQVLKIRAMDETRDQAWLDSQHQEEIEDVAERELAEQEPQKVAARRLSLLQMDKMNSSRRLSHRSSVLSCNTRRSSFITTGTFDFDFDLGEEDEDE